MNIAKFLRTPFHRTPLNNCFLTIQHVLADNAGKVLNGQQQHRKVVTFHLSRISPSLVTILKSFTTIIFYHILLLSFIITKIIFYYLLFIIFYYIYNFIFLLFFSYSQILNAFFFVLLLRKCPLQFPGSLLCYLLM